MNKTALVTLWVDPAEHQIVKYTFDNVWMDFLPAGWFVKVDDIQRVDDDGTAVPRRLAAARDEHPRRRHDGHGLARSRLRAPVRRLQAGRTSRSLIRIPESSRSAAAIAPRDASIRRADRPFVPSWTRPQATRRSKSSPRSASTATPMCATTRSSGSRASRSVRPLPDGRPARHRAAAQGQRPLRDRRGPQALSLAREPTDVALMLLVHERPGFTSETDRRASIDAVGAD